MVHLKSYYFIYYAKEDNESWRLMSTRSLDASKYEINLK